MSEDILERAKKALIDDDMTYEDYDECISLLIAEVERLRSLIDKPPEEADWVADYHLLQSALDGPIIDAARKWHAAYRKAQNSNLMRAKEVERLRSQLEESQIKYGVDIASTNLHWQDEIAAKDARIKELSDLNESLMENGNNLRTRCQKADADNRMLAMWNKKYMDHIERLEAAFLKAEKANLMHHMDADYADENAREELERIKGGGKDEQL